MPFTPYPSPLNGERGTRSRSLSCSEGGTQPSLHNARAEVLGAIIARCRWGAAAGMGASAGVRAMRAVTPSANLGDDLRVRRALELGRVVVVVGAGVARLLSAFLLHLERLDDGILDDLATSAVDRVGNVSMQLHAPVGIASSAILVELGAALIAEPCPQVVLAAARTAPIGELAARHGHEGTFGSLNDFQIADDESVIERHRAEGLQALVLAVVFHELDSDFGDDHV